MPEWLYPILIVVGYILVMRVILPRLGVQT
jgi:hypothetical protein